LGEVAFFSGDRESHAGLDLLFTRRGISSQLQDRGSPTVQAPGGQRARRFEKFFEEMGELAPEFVLPTSSPPDVEKLPVLG
jgi:hypothetical protein